MSELDLSKAIGAIIDGMPWGVGQEDDAREWSEEALTVALPALLEALAVKALAELDRRDWGSLQNITVAKWLRAKADEVRS